MHNGISMRAILIQILMLPLIAVAAGKEARFESAPIDPRDAVSIQRGAQVFVNYCLNCHGAESMRYNRLEDLGLTQQQIMDNLVFASDKVGDTMTVAMRRSDAKRWFGVAPPDLSVIARARGADWLYAYLRSFYRDDRRDSGWNNLVFPNVGMPHVLYELQGEQVLKSQPVPEIDSASGAGSFVLETPGKLSTAAYDRLIADLVNYLVYMSEPARETRIRIGYAVLIFLSFLFVPVYLLKKEYWKSIHQGAPRPN
ncbi:MAG TPA: cytochrome c1 [Burkholderiales bacterium]|nr:cytochrome c1 [Burkholderiales bacterium]